MTCVCVCALQLSVEFNLAIAVVSCTFHEPWWPRMGGSTRVGGDEVPVGPKEWVGRRPNLWPRRLI